MKVWYVQVCQTAGDLKFLLDELRRSFSTVQSVTFKDNEFVVVYTQPQ